MIFLHKKLETYKDSRISFVYESLGVTIENKSFNPLF